MDDLEPITMGEVQVALHTLGLTGTDAIKRKVLTNSGYYANKDKPEYVIPASRQEAARSLLADAAELLESRDKAPADNAHANGNGHNHDEVVIAALEVDECEVISDTCVNNGATDDDDEGDWAEDGPAPAALVIPASTDKDVFSDILTRARAVEGVEAAATLIHEAAAAFASQMQASQLINALMQKLPKGSVTKGDLKADFRNHRSQAVAQARAANSAEGGEGDKTNQTDYLLELAENNSFKAWRDVRTSGAILTVAPGYHVKADSRSARDALIRLYDASPLPGRRVLPIDNAKAVQSLLAARVSDAAPTNTTALRYAGVRDERGRLESIVIDIGDQTRCAYHVTPSGWSVITPQEVDALGVSILRPNDALPLDPPSPDAVSNEAAIEAIMALTSMQSVDDAKVCLGVLILSQLPSPDVTLPIFGFSGEPGAGKTTTAKNIKRLLDPASDAAGSKPKSEDDLYVVASTSRASVFDNLTSISGDISDAFCRIASGGAVPKRALYSDGEKVALFVHATSILTTIELRLLTRPDIVDRLVSFTLSIRPERLSDARVAELCNAQLPIIRRAMLDGLAAVLKHIDHDAAVSGERLTTTALVMAALDKAYPGEGFVQAFVRRRAVAAKSVALTDHLASALLRVVFANPARSDGGYRWRGLTTRLYNALPEQKPAPFGWPTNAVSFGIKLKSLAPLLKLVGAEIISEHTNAGSLVEISVAPQHVAGIRAAAVGAGFPFEPVDNDTDASSKNKNDRNKLIAEIGLLASTTTPQRQVIKQAIAEWCGDKGISNIHAAQEDLAEVEDLKKLLATVKALSKGGLQ
jgi:hypothetical protein